MNGKVFGVLLAIIGLGLALHGQMEAGSTRYHMARVEAGSPSEDGRRFRSIPQLFEDHQMAQKNLRDGSVLALIGLAILISSIMGGTRPSGAPTQ